jgi:hypothetical protein
VITVSDYLNYRFIKVKLWPFSLVFTLISGLFYNAIDLIGLGVVTLLLSMTYYAKRLSNKPSNNLWYQSELKQSLGD